MTLYLLDANVLIRANDDYYPIERIPHFWMWLVDQAAANVIKMPREIYEEVTPPPGEFAKWIGDRSVRDRMVLAEPTQPAGVRHVLEVGYAPDLTEVQLEKVGKDPFLIAAAMAGPERVVVTVEVRKPKRTRHNRKVPDVCEIFDIVSLHPFELYRLLNFHIPL